MKRKLTILLIAALLAILAFTTTIYEDGSYRSDFGLSGCIPAQLCN